MSCYQEGLNMENLLKESRQAWGSANRDDALKKIQRNFDEARRGSGCYGHDYAPVLEMLHLADDKLFPILGKVGVDEYFARTVLTPVFISNSSLARLFQNLPKSVLDDCILFFGSEHQDLFGK